LGDDALYGEHPYKVADPSTIYIAVILFTDKSLSGMVSGGMLFF